MGAQLLRTILLVTAPVFISEAGALTVGQYEAIQAFRRLDVQQANAYARPGSTQKTKVLLQDAVVSIDARPEFFEKLISEKYVTPDYRKKIAFDNDHVTTFSRYNYSSVGSWSSDGVCWLLPNARYEIYSNDSLYLKKLSFFSGREPQTARDGSTYYWYAAIPGWEQPQGKLFNMSSNRSSFRFDNSICHGEMPFFQHVHTAYTGFTDSDEVVRRNVITVMSHYLQDGGDVQQAGVSLRMLRDVDETTPCTPELCPDMSSSDGTADASRGEAPVDDSTSCSILDIPCNLRTLFIPRDNYLQSRIDAINASESPLPIAPVSRIAFGIPVREGVPHWLHASTFAIDFGDSYREGVGYTSDDSPRLLVQVLKFLAGIQVLGFAMRYLGLPHLLVNRVSGEDHDRAASEGKQ